MKIFILIGNNSYSTVFNFSKAISKAFQRQKIETKLFLIGNGCFYRAFYEIINDPPDLTFSFSNVTLAGRPLSEQLGIAHFSYLLDPGLYFMKQLEGKNSYVSLVDRKDLSVMMTCNRSSNCPIFLPHAVDQSLFDHKQEEPLYDLVMIGTCYDYEKIQQSWGEQFSPSVKKILNEAQEIVLSPSGLSCYEALQQLCGHIPEIQPHIITLHRELDLFITGKERVDLLRSLKGLPLHIFGKGPWKKYISGAKINPQIPFSKALKILKSSKVVLNSSPRFKDGSHERIYTSFATYALPLTGENPYLKEQFEDQKNILFYSYGNYQSLHEKVRGILFNEKYRKEMVECGRNITKTFHTWDARVSRIITHLTQK